jgi:hypothetical protein
MPERNGGITMNGFSRKEYLELKMPTASLAVSDQRRIELALEALGYGRVTMPLEVLRKLCRRIDELTEAAKEKEEKEREA